ncbi:MAG TPA: acetyltransferase [Nitrososphaera sp.]|nr:acetyltransferase [Nitrososphaera sp.]
MLTKVNEKLVAIVGFYDGSAGQVEAWFENVTGLEIACFVIDADDFVEVNIEEENRKRVCQSTDFPRNGFFKGHPLLVSSNWIELILDMGVRKVLCLDPDNRRRLAHIELIQKRGLQLMSAIHPSVLMMPGSDIADGVWINAGCIIGYKAEIRPGAIINTGVQIDHHNVLEECCQVDPGVITAGNVVLRRCCHIHTGAILINRVEIGENSVIGAGAVVLKDVPASCTAVGVPARVVKRDGPGPNLCRA